MELNVIILWYHHQMQESQLELFFEEILKPTEPSLKTVDTSEQEKQAVHGFPSSLSLTLDMNMNILSQQEMFVQQDSEKRITSCSCKTILFLQLLVL